MRKLDFPKCYFLIHPQNAKNSIVYAALIHERRQFQYAEVKITELDISFSTCLVHKTQTHQLCGMKTV